MKPAHVALVIAYGPEARAFIYSGLAARLAEEYRVSIIARSPGTKAFDSFSSLAVIQMPANTERPVLGELRSLWLRSQVKRIQSEGFDLWSHYLAATQKQVQEARGHPHSALGDFTARGVAQLVRGVEVWWGARFGTSQDWSELLKRQGIDCVVTAGYAGPYNLPGLQTASNMNIRTIVTTNSWKDVYATPTLL